MIEPMGRGEEAGSDRARPALDALYRREWPVVFAVVAAAVWNRYDAEELAQEVFSRSLPRLEADPDLQQAPRPFLITVAKNLVRDRARRRPLVLVPPAGLPEAPADPPGRSPEDLALAAERRMTLAAALAELSPDHRAVLRMRLLELRGTDEVAAVLGRSRGAVRQLQHRALLEMRRLVHGPEEEGE